MRIANMRLAVISDVHGNMVALQAVLDDLERDEIEHIVALGDMVQSGPQPAEVVAALRNLGCPVVMGNADAWLLSGVETSSEGASDEQLRKLRAVREWSLARLSAEDRAFIDSFAPTVSLHLSPGHSFLGFHGSPTDFDQFIFPETPESEFQALLGPYASHILAGGHVHLPFVRRLEDNFFFNPGSVGVAYNRQQDESTFRLDPWAEYAILTANEHHLGLEFRRVPYDIDLLVQVYRESGRPFASEVVARYGRAL
jgi:predicted phosphodiesterase